MRTIDIALDLHGAGIPVAGVDQTGVVKVPASTDRRAICATFRDGQPHNPAAVLGNDLVVIRFQNDDCYRRTIEKLRAKDATLFGKLALLRSPSGKWTVLFRVQGGAMPAGEILALDKSRNVLVEILRAGDLVVFGGQDAPVWRQGGVQSIPSLPLASVEILLAAGRKVNEWGEPDETNTIFAPKAEPEPATEATTEGATAEAAPAPETVEAPQAEGRAAGTDLSDLQTPAGFLALLYPDADFDGWLTFLYIWTWPHVRSGLSAEVCLPTIPPRPGSSDARGLFPCSGAPHRKPIPPRESTGPGRVEHLAIPRTTA